MQIVPRLSALRTTICAPSSENEHEGKHKNHKAQQQNRGSRTGSVKAARTYFSFNSLTLAPTEFSSSSSLFFLLSVFLRFLQTNT